MGWNLENNAQGVERDGPVYKQSAQRIEEVLACCLPNHPLVLLLPYVLRHMALDLPTTQRHGQCICHISLYRAGHRGVHVGRAYPDLRSALVLEFRGPQLGDLGAGDEGKDDIARKSGFEMILDA